MRRHHAVHDREPRDQRNAHLHQGDAGAARNREDQWNEEHEPDLEEDRDAHDEGDEHDGPVHAPLAKQANERGGDARRSTRLRHHLAQHRAEGYDDRDEPKDAAHAVLKCLDRAAERHAGHNTQRQRDRDQHDEGMKLESCDQDDQQHYRRERVQQQQCVMTHAARLSSSATMASGEWLMSHTQAPSSADGSSSVASWLSSSAAGMKCPRRAARRSSSNDRAPVRKTKRTSAAPRVRSTSRYCRLSAEQAIASPRPAPCASRRRAAIASSQGRRSSSVSGMPAAMRRTFSAGCMSSPSTKSRSSARANRAPIVVLPEPDTPMIT